MEDHGLNVRISAFAAFSAGGIRRSHGNGERTLSGGNSVLSTPPPLLNITPMGALSRLSCGSRCIFDIFVENIFLTFLLPNMQLGQNNSQDCLRTATSFLTWRVLRLTGVIPFIKRAHVFHDSPGLFCRSLRFEMIQFRLQQVDLPYQLLAHLRARVPARRCCLPLLRGCQYPVCLAAA